MLRDQCAEYLLQTTLNNCYYQYDISTPPPLRRPRIDLDLKLGRWSEQQGPDEKNAAAEDDLCSLSLGYRQSIDCSLQLGRLNCDQQPSTGCTADVSTSLTLCLPGSADRAKLNESRHGCHAGTAGTSQEILSTDNDLRTQFAQLEEDMAKFMKQKAARIYEEHLKITEQKTTSIENSIKRSCERQLAQKDLELEAMTKKNQELMQKVRAAEDEVNKYRFEAWRSSEELNCLRTEYNKARQESGENDATSRVSGVSGHIEDSTATKCRVCQDEAARILLLPCCHLSVCKGCDRSVDACPVCLCRRTQSIEV